MPLGGAGSDSIAVEHALSQATRQLRKLDYTGPIVALTAHAMADDCQKCLEAGCNDYATKPINREKLLATVAPWAAREIPKPNFPGVR